MKFHKPRSGKKKLRAKKFHKKNIFQHTAAIFQLAKIVLIISKSEQKCWKKQGTQNPKQNKQKKQDEITYCVRAPNQKRRRYSVHCNVDEI